MTYIVSGGALNSLTHPQGLSKLVVLAFLRVKGH